MMNDNPIWFERADYCARCQRNTLEAFDYFNNRMRLKSAADMSVNGQKVPEGYFKQAVYRLRCKSCGAAYKIRWINGCPYPIYYNDKSLSIQTFLSSYFDKDK